MSTLQQIRTQTRLLIDQTDSANSDFSDSELNGFVNEGARLLAPLIKWPRDRVEVQVEAGKPAYTLPVDNILILDAYFGDVSKAGDKLPLRVLHESQMKAFRPGWLDATADSRGRPDILILIDRLTAVLNPTPNADESVSGKKLEIVYVFYPATLSADGDTPDLPIVYHDFLSQYGQYKCYMSKLNKPELGSSIFGQMIQKAKLLEPVVTKEFNEQSFTWGNFAGAYPE